MSTVARETFDDDLNVVCGAPMRDAFGGKFDGPLVERNPLSVSATEVVGRSTGEFMRDVDMLTRGDSVPDQPSLVAISATSLVMQWNVSIASDARFLVELYRDADLMESSILLPSVRQYIFQELQPFTLYSANLAICNGTECGPPSAMAFAATWPSTPSSPLEVKAQPRAYNSLEVTWNPPASPNGQIEGYVAVTVQPYRECYSDNLQYRRCYIHDLPANITLEVHVFACNLPNAQQQGGGCGAFSNVTVAKMWNGGLDEELMVALAADNFTKEGVEAESTKSIPLFLPLSLIPTSETGPLNNISLVVQLADYAEGVESPELVLYDSYPYDDGVLHNHPIMGVQFSISYFYPEELLQTKIVSPVDMGDFNAYVFCLLNGPDQNLSIQYRLLQVMISQQTNRFQLTSKIAELLAGKLKRPLPYDQSVVLLGASWTQLLRAPKPQNYVRDITTTAVFIDASYVCAPNYERQSGGARVAPNEQRPDFIVATSPTRSTVGDFLFMLVQQRVKLLVMLDDLRMVNGSALTSIFLEGEEEEEEAEECVATVPYWPVGNTDGDEKMVELENFFSTYHACQVIRHAEKRTHDCCRRMLSITPVDVMQPWPLIQLHFTGWPRHGVPRVDIFYHFVIKCLKYLNDFPVGSDYGPLTVHSRPNDGRAGTFVCAAVLLNQLRSDSQNVDVFGTVLALSKYRPGIITSQDHLQFLYLFVQYCVDLEYLLPQSEDKEDECDAQEFQNFVHGGPTQVQENSFDNLVKRSPPRTRLFHTVRTTHGLLSAVDIPFCFLNANLGTEDSLSECAHVNGLLRE
ncbi:Receptor-type tyrosine-protein phosphatase eta [Taenia crassiceps]|uniref:Receptor-type tyrosine-protein phosphatase eta n=1 Tax=Taenia crassiceps TaxID=6207 RepID=A0ABR4QP82_9CEST